MTTNPTSPAAGPPLQALPLQEEGFFRGGYPFPWAPPGAAFWTALLESRRGKQALEKRHKGPPNKKGGKVEVVDKTTGEISFEFPPAFMYVSADDYLAELDRACLPNQIVVVPSVSVTNEDVARTLSASYFVAHAGTGQGMVFRADIPVQASGGMGDPIKKAYTDSLAMFSRGFLAIPRTDAPVEEFAPYEPQPQNYGGPAPSAPFQGAPQPGYGPGPGVPQGQGRGGQGYQAPGPQGQPVNGHPGGGGYSGRPNPVVPQQQQQPIQQGPPPQQMNQRPQGYQGQGQPQQGYSYPPQQQQGQGQPGPFDQGPRGGLVSAPSQGPRGNFPQGQGQIQGHPSLVNNPVVQTAVALLGPNSPLPGQGPEGPGFESRQGSVDTQDLTTPPPPAQAVKLRGVVEGEPQTVEEWADALIDKGWDEVSATNMAALRPDAPIPDTLRELIATKGLAYYGSGDAARAAFEGTGYTPQPGLPDSVKQRPTGLQILRYCRKINLKPTLETTK